MLRFLKRLFGIRDKSLDRMGFIPHDIALNPNQEYNISRLLNRVERLLVFKRQSPKNFTKSYKLELARKIELLAREEVVVHPNLDSVRSALDQWRNK
jgi:hypothetical protein